MMWPRPCRRMMGSAAWVAPSTATTFSSIRARSSSAVVCSSVAESPRPALLTSTSSRPQRAATSSTIARTASGVRHVHRVDGRLGASARSARPRAAPADPCGARTAPRACPAPANARAVAAPIPDDAPVTSATRPRGSATRAAEHAGDLVAVARHPGVETGGEQLHAGQPEACASHRQPRSRRRISGIAASPASTRPSGRMSCIACRHVRSSIHG